MAVELCIFTVSCACVDPVYEISVNHFENYMKHDIVFNEFKFIGIK